jgi:hypothetical protein
MGCGIIGNGERVLPSFIGRGAPVYEFARLSLPIGAQTPPQAADGRTWNSLPIAPA